MKKKIIVGLCVVVAVILLCPIPMKMEDGGTVVYKALLYKVWNVHRITPGGYDEGTIIEVLGIEIFNNTQ